MHIIVYMSRFTRTLSDDELASLSETAAARNRSQNISGVLLHDGHRIMQAVEGPRADVFPLMARIQADTRHHQISYVHKGAIRVRQFGSWSMRFARLDMTLSMARLRVQVADLLAGATEPSVKAAFFGFAATRR